MIGFLPIAILAYALEGGAIVVNKIQLQTRQLNPLAYTFYSGLLQGLALLLFPFGFKFDFSMTALFFATASGVIFVLALYALYRALQENEASVAGPLVGAFNPLFIQLLGAAILGQLLTQSQLVAFYVLILGGLIISLNLWIKLKIHSGFWWIVLSGLLLAISYIFLREAFLQTSFINGLILSRVAAAIFALLFLLIPALTKQIFVKQNTVAASSVTILFLFGQGLAAGGNFLIFLGTSLASPALVNAFFGVEYLVIMLSALILAKKAPQLLEENLSRGVLLQKILGAGILSLGIYLLSR